MIFGMEFGVNKIKIKFKMIDRMENKGRIIGNVSKRMMCDLKQLSDGQFNYQIRPLVTSSKDYTEYNKKLSEIMELVNDLSDKIYEGLFPLVYLGKWQEWDADQPIGSKLHVDENMLRNTGDKNIDILWELLDKVEDVIEKIGIFEDSQGFPEDFNPFEADFDDDDL